eukprot:scaffold71742_cov40-Attheya_sp.AAC.1
MQEGLALDGLASNSALYLPISLQNCTQVAKGSNPVNQSQPLWKASAIAAMALETATLPYRVSALNDRKRSKVGLVSGYFQGSSSSYDDDDGYATSPSLTWHEFVSTLKPSKESILELDVACSGGGLELNRRLLEGTSVKQKRLEEQRQRSRGRYLEKIIREHSKQIVESIPCGSADDSFIDDINNYDREEDDNHEHNSPHNDILSEVHQATNSRKRIKINSRMDSETQYHLLNKHD